MALTCALGQVNNEFSNNKRSEKHRSPLYPLVFLGVRLVLVVHLMMSRITPWKSEIMLNSEWIGSLPDWLPPAIWRISFVNSLFPNWQDRSCTVRGSPLSRSRSRKNSNVMLRAISYSMDSIFPAVVKLTLIWLSVFSLSRNCKYEKVLVAFFW